VGPYAARGNDIVEDLDYLIAVVIALAGLGGFVLLRGVLRFVVLIAALLIAAYIFGLLPPLRF
jgi:hypothetical protein